jgi:hypothetical protein
MCGRRMTKETRKQINRRSGVRHLEKLDIQCGEAINNYHHFEPGSLISITSLRRS